jgi:hypothetical protein
VSAEDSLKRIERDLDAIIWMVGGLYAVLVAAMWLLLRVAAKVGALG